MRKAKETTIGNGMAIFLYIMILVIAIVAGRPVLGHCEETNQGQRFIIRYHVEKTQEVKIDQGNVKMSSSSRIENKWAEIGFYKDKATAKKVGEERMKKLHPKDGSTKTSVTVIPYGE